MALITPQVTVHANLTSVTSLAVDARGAIWAGTSGGLVEWSPGAPPRVWTRADGMPGLRVRQVYNSREGIQVVADGAAVLRGGRFVPISQPSGPPMWSARDAEGLPGPPIARTMLGSKWVYAVPKAGLFTLETGKSIPLLPAPPTLQLTSVAVHGTDLYVGTSDRGVLRRTGAGWTALPLPKSALAGPDATALLPLGEQLWISPREGTSFQLGGQRSPARGAPWRTSASWAGQHLVRRADGRLVSVDKQGKETPSALVLPRVNANAIAVHGDTLFVVQPGGWSEFTANQPPRHRFDVPELQGAPTTTIFADAKTVAIGTQDRGLILVDRSTGSVKHVHEVHGLTDDWVTAIAPDGDGLLLGTFVGGLLRWDGERATQVGLKGGCINKLLIDGDRTWVGSLTGIHEWAGGKLKAPVWAKNLEPDVYDIARWNGRLWIAAGGVLFEINAY